MPLVSRMSAIACCDSRRASCRSLPRISSASRDDWPPPVNSRFIWLLPPEARARMITPGSWPVNWRRRSWAICSLDRFRSSFGTSLMLSDPRWVLDPPMKPPPPADAITVVASGTAILSDCSSRLRTASVRSMRVPTGSSTSRLTSPSSVCGISSNPMVGSSATATTNSPVPTASTVGRWFNAQCTRRRYPSSMPSSARSDTV